MILSFGKGQNNMQLTKSHFSSYIIYIVIRIIWRAATIIGDLNFVIQYLEGKKLTGQNFHKQINQILNIVYIVNYENNLSI